MRFAGLPNKIIRFNVYGFADSNEKVGVESAEVGALLGVCDAFLSPQRKLFSRPIASPNIRVQGDYLIEGLNDLPYTLDLLLPIVGQFAAPTPDFAFHIVKKFDRNKLLTLIAVKGMNSILNIFPY